MKRIISLGAAMLMLTGLSLLPTFAQDKMKGDKMGGGKMGGGKMHGDKMGGGKMSGDMMAKATADLSDDQKKYVMMKMSKMSAADKIAMEKKLAGYSPSVRKGQVTRMMNKDKMGGDKMGGGKMHGDKMGGDKMKGDKMGSKK